MSMCHSCAGEGRVSGPLRRGGGCESRAETAAASERDFGIVGSWLVYNSQGGGRCRNVEMNGAAAANGGSVSANKAEKAAFKAEAKRGRRHVYRARSFAALWNGVSIQN